MFTIWACILLRTDTKTRTRAHLDPPNAPFTDTQANSQWMGVPARAVQECPAAPVPECPGCIVQSGWRWLLAAFQVYPNLEPGHRQLVRVFLRLRSSHLMDGFIDSLVPCVSGSPATTFQGALHANPSGMRWAGRFAPHCVSICKEATARDPGPWRECADGAPRRGGVRAACQAGENHRTLRVLTQCSFEDRVRSSSG